MSDDALTMLPLETIGTSVGWFKSQLEAQRIRLHEHASLAVALKRLDVLKEEALAGQSRKFSTADDAYAFFAEAIGADFLTKTIHKGAEAGLVLGRDRWRHFTAECATGTTLLQVSRSTLRSESATPAGSSSKGRSRPDGAVGRRRKDRSRDRQSRRSLGGG